MDMCVSQSEIWREKCRSLVPCILNGAPQCFSLGSFLMLPLPPFAFPHECLMALSQAVPLWQLPFAVLMLPPSPTPSCWNCACHSHGLCSAQGRDVQRSSKAEMCRGLPAAPKPSTNTLVYPTEGELAVQSCVEYGFGLPQFFVLSENPTLCTGCDKALPVSEEGQKPWLK